MKRNQGREEEKVESSWINSIYKTKNRGVLKLIDSSGEVHFVNINFIKHILEIPYIKKDGTPISGEELRCQKK